MFVDREQPEPLEPEDDHPEIPRVGIIHTHVGQGPLSEVSKHYEE